MLAITEFKSLTVMVNSLLCGELRAVRKVSSIDLGVSPPIPQAMCMYPTSEIIEFKSLTVMVRLRPSLARREVLRENLFIFMQYLSIQQTTFMLATLGRIRIQKNLAAMALL